MNGARRLRFRAFHLSLIGSKDPHALEIPARRAVYSLTESALSPLQAEPTQGADLAIRRIQHFIGPDTRIYEPKDFQSYLFVPTLTVRQVLPDIYKLRNKFAHGEWVPKDFLERPGYSGEAGETLNYADVLLEATGIILRMCLIRILRESFLEVFRTKDALNWYFSRAGLVSKKKPIHGFMRREPSFH